jgi:hypothetical protein
MDAPALALLEGGHVREAQRDGASGVHGRLGRRAIGRGEAGQEGGGCQQPQEGGGLHHWC